MTCLPCRLLWTFVVSCLLWGVTGAVAQPVSRPIRLIVPTPAGGPSDMAARAVAGGLSKAVGQPVVVENRPGANGAVAAQALLASAPDGHTLLWGLASMAGIPMLQRNAPFQSLAELVPLTVVGHFAFGLFVNPDVPATTVAAFVAHAKANPDKLAFAYGSLGELMAATQLTKAAGVRSVPVPYKGAAQLMPDLITGRVQWNVGPVSGGLGYLKDGRLRLLAVAAPRRSVVVPDVPTIAEAGYPGVELPTWQAIFAPPKAPGDVVQALAREIAAALRDPGLRAQLEQQALVVEGSTPQGLAERVARDTEAWRQFVREHALTPE
jgi:tripartite-type tricarboxylate transporter receptor subunit TctC